MSSYVENISAYGIYNRFDLTQDFSPGVNILFGDNGSGKTTLLHILANVLNGDYDRFAFLNFKHIRISLSDGQVIHLRRIKKSYANAGLGDSEETIKINSDDGQLFKFISIVEILQNDLSFSTEPLDKSKHSVNHNLDPLLSVAYFPAFRVSIDAWKSEIIRADSNVSELDLNDLTTLFLRRWLTSFVPIISFPSADEIVQQIKKETSSSNLVLIEEYLKSVNSILTGKKIIVNKETNKPPVEIEFEDGFRSKGFTSLSSGENQIAKLIYAAARISKENVILVDEPEISLHVDWQRQLIKNLQKQASNRQIIVCTHSPMIGADFEEQVVNLHMEPISGHYTSNSSEEEIPY